MFFYIPYSFFNNRDILVYICVFYFSINKLILENLIIYFLYCILNNFFKRKKWILFMLRVILTLIFSLFHMSYYKSAIKYLFKLCGIKYLFKEKKFNKMLIYRIWGNLEGSLSKTRRRNPSGCVWMSCKCNIINKLLLWQYIKI